VKFIKFRLSHIALKSTLPINTLLMAADDFSVLKSSIFGTRSEC
jgi:hypothetical protein